MTHLAVSRSGSIETWALDRPAVRNALGPDLVAELRAALWRAEREGVRAVILKGNGPSFCAGADLTYLQACARDARSARPFLTEICEFTIDMESSGIVFIAALHGHAVAGGLELALACDVVIAAAGTRIGDGHVRNNLLPGGGSSLRLPAKLGQGPAAWLGLSGELVTAEDLLLSGWLHSVVSHEHLLETVMSLARTLIALPAGAQRRFKTLLHEDADVTRARLSRELDAFEAHWASADIASSLGAFLTRTKELDSA